ncbi:M16 family metallopeptidase [Anaerofustis stercorihominis]|uniref:Peptidase, M16 family n=2 Tax=Anaerofustis stercorihominis TaxID=214853 RepID=B1C8L1_9FIRM|nr:pitrilysin family protein [Anaerofustis stercorihominis]EDS71921.1 peptidase, M16 family [Anaerofustis stercorihominis DSM 17244]RGD75023.1 insulinase family protein [Anaerofustis stercorihominis]
MIKNGNNNVIICKNENLHNIGIGFYFHGGVLYENNKVRGISHLLEHMFFRKLNNLSQRELYKKVNKIGVALSGTTYKDYIRFYATVLPQYFNDFIDIIVNIYEDFLWSNEEINAEKEVVKRQIEDKSFYHFDDIVNKNYFEGSCFKNEIMGDCNKIDNLSYNIINDYKRRFFNKDNSVVVLTGSFNSDNINYLNKKLESISIFLSNPLMRQHSIPTKFCKRDEHNIMIIPSVYDTTEIEIRIDISKEIDMHEVEILFNILAVGDGSRLSFKLKDTLGYIGDFDCDLNYYEDFNTVILVCSVDNHLIIKTLNIIFEEIKNMKNDITKEDLEEVIVFSKDFSNVIDSSEGLNDLIGYERFVLGNKNYNIENEVKVFEMVTVKNLLKTAKRIFKSENISIYVENNSNIERKYKVKDCIYKIKEAL